MVERGRGSECMVGLECLLDIVRALGMGSCLSAEPSNGRAGATTSSSSSSMAKRRKLQRTSSSSSYSSPYATTESKMGIWLRRVPGRMCLNGSSHIASLFTKQGRKGVNQDAMIVWEVYLMYIYIYI